MNIEKICEQGEISASELFEILICKLSMARRTHFLSKGDYVIMLDPLRKYYFALEKIAELDSPEQGSFTTVKGSFGHINANFFIKIKNGGDFYDHLLIEGDEVNGRNCYVLKRVDEYLEDRAKFYALRNSLPPPEGLGGKKK